VFETFKPARAKFTIAILGEGISTDLLQVLKEELGQLEFEVGIFAIAPEPKVQVLFRGDFDDDAVIFAEPEQSRMGRENLAAPAANCYVVSQYLPAYCVSYYGGKPEGPAKDILLEQVREWSHLSWLTVKPGSEKRTVSYPLQIVALIRKTAPLCSHISMYEFLPSSEQI
jgi:hypothetical protein